MIRADEIPVLQDIGLQPALDLLGDDLTPHDEVAPPDILQLLGVVIIGPAILAADGVEGGFPAAELNSSRAECFVVKMVVDLPDDKLLAVLADEDDVALEFVVLQPGDGLWVHLAVLWEFLLDEVYQGTNNMSEG